MHLICYYRYFVVDFFVVEHVKIQKLWIQRKCELYGWVFCLVLSCLVLPCICLVLFFFVCFCLFVFCLFVFFFVLLLMCGLGWEVGCCWGLRWVICVFWGDFEFFLVGEVLFFKKKFTYWNIVLDDEGSWWLFYVRVKMWFRSNLESFIVFSQCQCSFVPAAHAILCNFVITLHETNKLLCHTRAPMSIIRSIRK